MTELSGFLRRGPMAQARPMAVWAALLGFLLLAAAHSVSALRLNSFLAAGMGWMTPGRPKGAAGAQKPDAITVPKASSVGFLPVNPSKGSEMFYMYYEAQEVHGSLSSTPIVLWLQVRDCERNVLMMDGVLFDAWGVLRTPLCVLAF